MGNTSAGDGRVNVSKATLLEQLRNKNKSSDKTYNALTLTNLRMD